MRNWLVLLALIVLWPATALATAQFGDRLIYKGTEYQIYTNPLEMYFDEQHPRPEKLFLASCTACWRGYMATFEIKDDGYLYLVKLVAGTCGGDAPEIPLDKVFPGQTGPIRATWFSGMIKIPQGAMLHYVHMGYQSVYEKELHLVLENGKVLREETIDNRKPEDKAPPETPDKTRPKTQDKTRPKTQDKTPDKTQDKTPDKTQEPNPRKPRIPVG